MIDLLFLRRPRIQLPSLYPLELVDASRDISRKGERGQKKEEKST